MIIFFHYHRYALPVSEALSVSGPPEEQKVKGFFPASVERVWFSGICTSFQTHSGKYSDGGTGTKSVHGENHAGSPECFNDTGICGDGSEGNSTYT